MRRLRHFEIAGRTATASSCVGTRLLRACLALAAAVLLLPAALMPSTLRAQDDRQPPETAAPPPNGAPLMNLPPQFRERMQRAQQGLPVEGQHPIDPSLIPPSRLSDATAPRPGMPAPVPQSQSAAGTSAPLPTSLLSQPAHRATVTLDANGLYIKADNSSLTQILNTVSSSAGMKIEGLGRDERIYGTYGPGEPHEVLNSLLYGSAYNVLMVGSTPIGAPRQLILTTRAGQTVASAMPQTASASEDDEEDIPYQDPDAPQPVQPTVQTPAVTPVPSAPPTNNPAQPATTQPDASQSGTDSQGPKTAQQLFEQLQKMHQQQAPAAAQPTAPATTQPQ